MEGIGQRHGHEKGHGSGRQRPQLDHRLGAVRCVQPPCELRPGPPDEPEHESGLADGRPVKAVMQNTNNLCHGENKNQIKE